MEEIIVRVIDFGNCAADGLTIKDSDDNYNVYLNSRLSHEKQLQAFEHEMRHIRMGHFWSDRPVKELEIEAEKGTAALSDGLVKNTNALG